MWFDLRYALRTLARERGFAVVAVATLALGIGANTAIFSLVHGILLKPLPFRDPDRLYAVREIVGQVAHLHPTVPVNARHFFEWREQCRSIEQIAAISLSRMTLAGAGEPEEAPLAAVSASLFPMLGVTPQLGRSFLEEEDAPGRDQVVLLSDSLWRRRFSAERNILGRQIRLDGKSFTVIGVLPPGFRFPSHEYVGDWQRVGPRIDVFKPIAFRRDQLEMMGEFNYGAIARLKPGVTPQQALSELNVLQTRLARASGENVDLRAWLRPLHDQLAADARRALLVLMAAVGAVLLIVCVNLANVLLARATGRGRDAAIRAALGAGPGRLVRQALAEAAVLALFGGLLGAGAAYLCVRFVLAVAPVNVPRLEEVTVDGPVLVFAILISALTALLFGGLPAWRLAAAQPLDALKAGGRALTEARRGLRLRRALVAFEVALSTVLLAAAGLLLSSFLRLMNTEKGFEVERVLAADIALPPARYAKAEQRTAFYDRLLEKVRSIPGVIAAGHSSLLPLQGEANITILTLAGDRRRPFERPLAYFRVVSPEYFRTLGIPVLRGRVFEERDRSRRTIILSERAAARLWPGEDPIGKLLHDGDTDDPLMEVIGVAGDVRVASLEKDPGNVMYFPHWHRRVRPRASLVVRTAMDPLAAARALRAAVWSIDPEVPVAELQTMQEVVDASVAERRFQMGLVAAFAAAALLLAAIGIYGVVSYAVARRRNEIGIRLALGARAADVRGMVLRQGMAPVAAGLAAGIAGALALGRLLGSLLYQVKPADPIILASVAAVLAAVALAACWVPALRATRTDPMTALRYE